VLAGRDEVMKVRHLGGQRDRDAREPRHA